MGDPPSALKALAWYVKRCCDATGSPNATSMSRLVQRILLNDMVPPFVWRDWDPGGAYEWSTYVQKRR